MPLRQEYLISYDVEDTKVRTRLYKELERYGLRAVQKSVFWGFLTKAELHSIQRFMIGEFHKTDKAFIALSGFNSKETSFFIGHSRTDFQDWKEADVI